MTEVEWNTAIEKTNSELLPRPNRKTGRAYRRKMRIRKYKKIKSIVTRHYFMWHIGYVSGSGKYIKYPKNSNCRKRIKRTTSKMVRKYPDFPKKGCKYRRVFDYWWTLY